MSWPDRIVIDPEILAGKPVIRGTRLAVEFILDLLAVGESEASPSEFCRVYKKKSQPPKSQPPAPHLVLVLPRSWLRRAIFVCHRRAALRV